MSTETKPIFVVGSGRSGTRTVFKLLSGLPNIEIHHEYVCTHIQPVAALYYMQRMNKEAVKRCVETLYTSAIHYSHSRYWVDCSNKLSWIIEPLLELFPEAKFVNLVRDGRKVANSYYRKLSDEMYDDSSVRIMEKWLANPDKFPQPPPEKKYWWNIPQTGQPFAREFPSFNQFQRACYHWVESNRVVMESLQAVPAEQQLFVKLEDLTTDSEVLGKFLTFFEIEYEDHFFEFLQTPQNVIFPMDFKLTAEQVTQFNRIAGTMVEILGYAGTPEYRVEY